MQTTPIGVGAGSTKTIFLAMSSGHSLKIEVVGIKIQKPDSYEFVRHSLPFQLLGNFTETRIMSIVDLSPANVLFDQFQVSTYN